MTRTISQAEVSVQAYLDAWNAHDGAAVVATLAPDGTYDDPVLPGPIGGDHLAAYVGALAAGLPDVQFVADELVVTGDRVVLPWRMLGTHTGPLPDAPEPTGRPCDLPGVDVITVGADGITSVVGYFDRRELAEQLGSRTVVLPADEPPIAHGVSVRTDLGNPATPGALAMTWIEVGPEDEAETSTRAGEVLQGLCTEPGFLGFLGSLSGGRAHTVTSWTSPDAAASAMARNAPHRAAVERVQGGFGRRAFTSIWVPQRLNPQMATCPSCGNHVGFDAGTAAPRCDCGAEITVASYL